MFTLPGILSSPPQISRSVAVALVPLSLCFLVFAFHYLRRKSSGINQRELPSPPGDPILGHLRFVPLKATWLTFADWYKKYGEIILVKMFNKPMVILNSAEAAHELLEKKGANFSGRPPFRFFRYWLGWKDALPFMQYDDDNYHKQRRIMRPYLSPQAVVDHHPILYEYAQVLQDNLRDSPDNFVEHIQSYISCVMVAIIYGYKPSSKRDPQILMVEAVGRTTAEVEMTTVMILDLLPFLRHLPAWLPGMGAKRHARKGNELRREMEESFLSYVLDCKEATAQNKSLMLQVLDDMDKEAGNVESAVKDTQLGMNVMQMGAVLYTAAVDASTSPLTAFILAMTLHPHVALRAQGEIDEVTGGPGVRLPSFEDRKHMPYIECIIKEVLRWNPPGPLGIVHRSEHADEYRGMEIPANSSIIANIWFMCHDETHFPSPNEFNPDRYSGNTIEDGTEELTVNLHDPKNIVFGFGRRICPGENIADAMLWTAITFILSIFDILPPLDPDSGEAIMPTAGFTAGTSSHPKQFACRIVPRK